MRNTQQEIATPDTIVDKKVRSQLKFGTTKWLTYAAVFAALALGMKLLGQIGTLNDSFKITPIYTVWLCAAAALGPFGGGIVCFTSDLLGAIILPQGVYNPLLTVGCTLYGVIAGLCFRIPTRTNIARFVIAGVVTMVSISLIFDSFAIWVWCRYVMKYGSWINRTLIVYIGMRLLQCLMSLVNIPIAIALIPVMNRLKLLPTTAHAKPKAPKITPKHEQEALAAENKN